MFIGNIVSETEVKINDGFNIVSDINNIISDIPTLIIGWGLIKTIYGDDKPSILEKQIDDLTYWEFSKREKRIDYENGLPEFIKVCFEHVENKLNYEFIDVLTIKYSFLKKLLKILNNEHKNYIYVKNNSFAYILNEHTVYGVDFNAIDFLNLNRKNVYRRLYSLNNEIHFNEDIIPKILRKEIKSNKIIPFLIKTIKEHGV
jgi:hypothetical protein